MKKLLRLFLLPIILLLPKQVLMASCIENYVGIFPGRGNIAANPIFVIDFTQDLFPVKEYLDDMIFQARVTAGFPVRLYPVQVNFSGTMGQVILKPAHGFRLNDSVGIEVRFRSGATMPQEKRKAFNWPPNWMWKVAMPDDREPPAWTPEPLTYHVPDTYSRSTMNGYAVYFSIPVTDNSFAHLQFSRFDSIVNPLFYEVTFAGSTFVMLAHRFAAPIYAGQCGRNFSFSTNQDYTAVVRPLDFSGNYATTSRTITVSTTSRNEY